MLANDWRLWNALSDVGRLLEQVGGPFARRWDSRAGRTAPAVNIWANQDALVITSEVPGVDPATVGVTVLGDTVTISGKLVATAAVDSRQTERSEDFERSIQLPFRVDPDRTEARVVNGVLTVALHRPEAEKPRKIQVTAA